MEIELQKDRFHIEITKNQPDISDFDPLKTPKQNHRRSMEVTVNLSPSSIDDFNMSPSRSTSLRNLQNPEIPKSPGGSRSHDKGTMARFIATPIQKRGRFSIHHEHPVEETTELVQTNVKPKIMVRRVTLEPLNSDFQKITNNNQQQQNSSSEQASNNSNTCNIFFPDSPKVVNDLIDFS